MPDFRGHVPALKCNFEFSRSCGTRVPWRVDVFRIGVPDFKDSDTSLAQTHVCESRVSHVLLSVFYFPVIENSINGENRSRSQRCELVYYHCLRFGVRFQRKCCAFDGMLLCLRRLNEDKGACIMLFKTGELTAYSWNVYLWNIKFTKYIFFISN